MQKVFAVFFSMTLYRQFWVNDLFYPAALPDTNCNFLFVQMNSLASNNRYIWLMSNSSLAYSLGHLDKQQAGKVMCREYVDILVPWMMNIVENKHTAPMLMSMVLIL